MLVFPIKKLQRIAELYPADDDCVVLKTLIRNNNQEIDQQDRRMIKNFYLIIQISSQRSSLM